MCSVRYLSPLRYPGGKAAIAHFVGALIASQPSKPSQYVEPFAGGFGVGLRLLYDEYVEHVVLNDLDADLAAFWRCVFFETDALLERVRQRQPSLAEWHRQHDLYLSGDGDLLDRAFATFYLNRTNRSGILLDARPIGGMHQSGKWRINARYNAAALADRIERVARYRNRVTVLSRDGIAVAKDFVGDERSLVYLDPPYVQKGAELYFDNLTKDDHLRLANVIAKRKGWVMTYDVHSLVRALYLGHRRAVFSIAHTAGPQRLGREYLIFARGLIVPPLARLGHGARFTRSQAP
jgi:DNA adenine methylase